tara:strand:+ start:2054 stop:2272 length:219 start_codon:yes stop_codon:yes gene_type:complete
MFNVGDVITASANTFVVTGLIGDDRIVISYEGEHHGDYPARLFTLVTPAGPPPSVLTGMAQFFKDMKESNSV